MSLSLAKASSHKSDRLTCFREGKLGGFGAGTVCCVGPSKMLVCGEGSVAAAAVGG